MISFLKNIALRTCHITKLASSYVVTNTVMKKMTWLAMSYSEAGENKQALVKLVTCERCADKLHYKRQKEKKQSEKREREENKRKRNRSRSIDETDNNCEGSKERRKVLNIPLEKRLQFQLMITKLMMMITLMSFLRGCFHDRLLPYLDG